MDLRLLSKKILLDESSSDSDYAPELPPKEKKRRSDGYSREKKLDVAPEGLWGRDIPPEVLLCIFRRALASQGAIPLLFRLSRVCTLWRSVARTEILWRRIILTGNLNLKTSIQCQFACDRLRHARSLTLSNCRNLSAKAFETISDSCRQLDELTVSKSGLLSRGLSVLEIVLNNSSLTHLSLLSLPSGSIGSLKEALEKRALNLRFLNLRGSEFTCALSLLVSAIAASCSYLRHLDLSETGRAGFFPIHELQLKCPNLEVLSLDDLLFLEPFPISNYVKSCPGFPCLNVLTLAKARFMTPSRTWFLEAILGESGDLKALDIRYWQVSLVDFISVAGTTLRRLYCGSWPKSVNVQSFLAVLSTYTELVELDLSHCFGVNDEVVMSLADFSLASTLEVLDLSSTVVTQVGVERILNRCNCLRSLNLTGCRGAPRGWKRDHDPESLQELRSAINKTLE
ncbi:F-box/LRR-repeat protein 6-like [Oscarella lobularis]|uniref:F-box/LRR-repeat protein 6-like n=1 Tax=Oscarella lobularis TaxID=121494 RepID=UPI0033140D50